MLNGTFEYFILLKTIFHLLRRHAATSIGAKLTLALSIENINEINDFNVFQYMYYHLSMLATGSRGESAPAHVH